jgi:tricorn protease
MRSTQSALLGAAALAFSWYAPPAAAKLLPALDGGVVCVPEFGTADENGHWLIEGRGVDPDIAVEQDPVEVLNGHDPQLERAVVPAGLPRPPAAPAQPGVP